jgi:hypothetical protein
MVLSDVTAYCSARSLRAKNPAIGIRRTNIDQHDSQDDACWVQRGSGQAIPVHSSSCHPCKSGYYQHIGESILSQCMASSSSTIKTPAQAHPLSADELANNSKGRRRATQQETNTTATNSNNYFLLRAQLESSSHDTVTGSQEVRGEGVREKSVRQRPISR